MTGIVQNSTKGVESLRGRHFPLNPPLISIIVYDMQILLTEEFYVLKAFFTVMKALGGAKVSQLSSFRGHIES